MIYEKSKKIFEEIIKAKKILVNLHRGPDGDSVGSALALYHALTKLGKDVTVVLTSTSEIPSNLTFLPETGDVEKVDFSEFDFLKYDLFIIPDCADWQMVTYNPNVPIPNIKTIVIDHHETNMRFGSLNIVDSKKSSCAEIIYLIFKDLKLEIDKTIANLLLAGIISDTGTFRFSNDPEYLVHAAQLMELGGNKNEIIRQIFGTIDFETAKVFGEFFRNMEIDAENRFFYTILGYSDYSKYGKPAKVSSLFATHYGGIIKNTDFGIIILEKEKNIFDISLRSRDKFDVSKMAIEFGGGGHKAAAGGQITGVSEEAVIEKVIKIAKKYAKKV